MTTLKVPWLNYWNSEGGRDAGCNSYRPTDNVGFDKIETLKELEGVYQNRGEGEQGHPEVPLIP
jgi:hypothetical protein